MVVPIPHHTHTLTHTYRHTLLVKTLAHTVSGPSSSPSPLQLYTWTQNLKSQIKPFKQRFKVVRTQNVLSLQNCPMVLTIPVHTHTHTHTHTHLKSIGVRGTSAWRLIVSSSDAESEEIAFLLNPHQPAAPLSHTLCTYTHTHTHLFVVCMCVRVWESERGCSERGRARERDRVEERKLSIKTIRHFLMSLKPNTTLRKAGARSSTAAMFSLPIISLASHAGYSHSTQCVRIYPIKANYYHNLTCSISPQTSPDVQKCQDPCSNVSF